MSPTGRCRDKRCPNGPPSLHGSWPTPITSELVVRAAARLGEVVVDGSDVWWSEGRPAEGGRSVIVRRSADGTTTDVLPAPFNARTRVHEYGGGSWTVSGGVLWFTNFADQRLYRLDPGSDTPVAVSPEPAVAAGVRHADFVVTDAGLLAVRETHAEGGRAADVVNEIVRVAPDGSAEVLVSGPDFVSDPRPGPDGALAWLQWNHPDMPWDAAQLVVRASDGTETVVAGGAGESVVQPGWTPDGSLLFLSDRTDLWCLYRWRPGGEVELVVDAGCDIAGPQWVFGQSRYALLPDGRLVLAYARAGADRLAVAEDDGRLRELDLPYAVFRYVTAADGGGLRGGGAVVRAGGAAGARGRRRPRGAAPRPRPRARPRLVLGARARHLPDRGPRHRHRRGARAGLPADEPGGDGAGRRAAAAARRRPRRAHRERRPVLNLEVQYWTSRGFCVADVDYRGSTGYGRRYRDALQGRWGILDLDDVVACARFLADAGRVDPARMAIRGGSAGGYTTLAALSMRAGVFTAGASHFGVADLGALASETHKFESRYLDGLVAPWPEGRAVYDERSPIHHVDALDTPLAVFQGDEDAVVPPDQAEMIVAALREKKVPHAYLLFEGEQHGFRKAENIRAALDGELSFYAQVWGFDLPEAEGIPPIAVRRG